MYKVTPYCFALYCISDSQMYMSAAIISQLHWLWNELKFVYLSLAFKAHSHLTSKLRLPSSLVSQPSRSNHRLNRSPTPNCKTAPTPPIPACLVSTWRALTNPLSPHSKLEVPPILRPPRLPPRSPSPSSFFLNLACAKLEEYQLLQPPLPTSWCPPPMFLHLLKAIRWARWQTNLTWLPRH